VHEHPVKKPSCTIEADIVATLLQYACHDIPRHDPALVDAARNAKDSKSLKQSGKKTTKSVRDAAQGRDQARRRTAGADRRIYDSVFSAVMRQRLPPGTKLTEATFCKLFKVSRTIVRKALQRLAHEHIIELRPNRGAIVAQPTPQETREIFVARRAVEAAIVPLATERATRPQIARLRSLVREEEAAFHRGDRTDWIRRGGEFHLILAEVAGNKVLLRYLTELVSRCSLIIALYESPGSIPCASEEHNELIDLIAGGETRKAVDGMDRHLLAIERKLKLEDGQDSIDLAQILGVEA
jgi:DNA-binding GntR family transcriptional regulator